MPQAIGAALITAFGGSVAAAGASTAGALVVSAATATTVGSLAIAGGMMALNYGLSKVLKPDFDLTSGQGQLISAPSTAAPRLIVYGQQRIGGVVTGRFFSGAKNEYMYHLYTLTGHEVESIEGIYFNDELVTFDGSHNATGKYANVCWAWTRLGAVGETAFEELTGASLNFGVTFTSHDRQDGCAKVLIKVKYDQNKWTSGYPSKINFLVRGKKVYDPRDGQTKWSANPALCYRDFMADPLYGFGATADELNDDGDNYSGEHLR